MISDRIFNSNHVRWCFVWMAVLSEVESALNSRRDDFSKLKWLFFVEVVVLHLQDHVSAMSQGLLPLRCVCTFGNLPLALVASISSTLALIYETRFVKGNNSLKAVPKGIRLAFLRLFGCLLGCWFHSLCWRSCLLQRKLKHFVVVFCMQSKHCGFGCKMSSLSLQLLWYLPMHRIAFACLVIGFGLECNLSMLVCVVSDVWTCGFHQIQHLSHTCSKLLRCYRLALCACRMQLETVVVVVLPLASLKHNL
jgi:hypothetical protein